MEPCDTTSSQVPEAHEVTPRIDSGERDHSVHPRGPHFLKNSLACWKRRRWSSLLHYQKLSCLLLTAATLFLRPSTTKKLSCLLACCWQRRRCFFAATTKKLSCHNFFSSVKNKKPEIGRASYDAPPKPRNSCRYDEVRMHLEAKPCLCDTTRRFVRPEAKSSCQKINLGRLAIKLSTQIL